MGALNKQANGICLSDLLAPASSSIPSDSLLVLFQYKGQASPPHITLCLTHTSVLGHAFALVHSMPGGFFSLPIPIVASKHFCLRHLFQKALSSIILPPRLG